MRAWLVAAIVLPSLGARAWADADAPPPPRPFETVVTAPPEIATPRADQLASGSVVSPDDSPRAHDDLGTLMLEVPGVTTIRTGALGSSMALSLRGSNVDQVRVYIDGVPVAIAEGGGVDLSTLPLGDVERVEVYRGQAPLSFGESALGGILSITTRTPGTPSVGARAGLGSYGAYFGDANAGGRVGRLRLYLGVHALSSKGDFPYLNDNGTPLNSDDDRTVPRQNADVRQADGTFRAAVDLRGRRTLSLGVIAFGRDQGLPGPHLVQTRFVRFATARALAYLRYESRDDLGPNGRLAAQLFFSAERDHYTDPGEISAGAWDTHDTTLSTGFTASASRPLAEWLRLAAVAEARAETFQPVNDSDEMPMGAPARRLVAVGGVEATFQLRRADLDLVPSVRVEEVQDVVTGRDPLFQTARPAAPPVTHTLPIVRLAALRPFGPHVTLKANVGRYARTPSFLELYAGTGRLLGNPALTPEWGANGDVSLLIDAGTRVRVASRTAVFGALVNDLIEWQHNSAGQSRPLNVGSARIVGVEEELRVAVGRWGRFVGQGTFLDARDESDNAAHHGRQLPLRPRWQAYARPELVNVPLRRGGDGAGGVGPLDAGAFVDGALFAGSYDDPTNLFKVPSRVLLGAGFGVEAPRLGLRLTCSGQNLTNTPVFDMAYWPLPGRTIFFALAWRSALGRSEIATNTTN